MKRALVLARKALGQTAPNPLVGAIVLDVKGRCVGRGFHPKAGQPHAEVFALKEAGDQAKGGTLYVTLEPCAHTGKTPPCTEAIVAAGIRHVVVAIEDPNPLVAGQGLLALREAGITVEVGECAKEASRLNRVFLKWIQKQTPFVTAKVAVDQQNVMGQKGERLLISDPMMEKTTMKLRAGAGALLVGVGTVLTDDPKLTVRGGFAHGQLTRIIVDPFLKTPASAKLFASDLPVWIFHAPDAKPEDSSLKEKATLIPGEYHAQHILRVLQAKGIQSVLIEGGRRTLQAFHEADLIDEWILYVNHRSIKPKNPILLDLTPPLHLLVESAIKRAHDWEIVGKHVHRDH